MEETLDMALERLFSDNPRGPAQPPASLVTDESSPSASEPASLRAEALAHYCNAMQAQPAGDWGRYGDEIRRLGEVLEQAR
jgi:uncharacterized membrane protein (UPF0182 family)